MAVDAEFDRAGAAHARRKRGYVRHNPGDVIPFATTLEVQDHADLKAMAHADGMTISAFCTKLIERERKRRLRIRRVVAFGGDHEDVSGSVGTSVEAGCGRVPMSTQPLPSRKLPFDTEESSAVTLQPSSQTRDEGGTFCPNLDLVHPPVFVSNDH